MENRYIADNKGSGNDLVVNDPIQALDNLLWELNQTEKNMDYILKELKVDLKVKGEYTFTSNKKVYLIKYFGDDLMIYCR